MHMNANSLQAEIAESALIGKVLAAHREHVRRTQADIAAKLGMSQSAYSRLEAGASAISAAQLRAAARAIGSSASSILTSVDEYERQLSQQGVRIVPDKRANPAAVAVGLGVLTALLMSRA